jgi:membrane associated rhomboid family serine protease
MIPLKDDNPTRRFPIVTVILIAINSVVFAYQLVLPHPVGARLVADLGAIPKEVLSHPFGGGVGAPAALTLFTSMFLHGSVLHLVGNMLYLWIFGNNIEDTMGRGRFVLFYLLSGLGAHAAHNATSAGSDVPTIGASGAIAGILGAYMVLYPGARVLTVIPLGFFTRFIWIPAVFVLGFWFVIQFLNGLPALGAQGGGVAWFAHIGGFVAGLLLVMPFAGGRRRRAPWGGGI